MTGECAKVNVSDCWLQFYQDVFVGVVWGQSVQIKTTWWPMLVIVQNMLHLIKIQTK